MWARRHTSRGSLHTLSMSFLLAICPVITWEVLGNNPLHRRIWLRKRLILHSCQAQTPGTNPISCPQNATEVVAHDRIQVHTSSCEWGRNEHHCAYEVQCRGNIDRIALTN